MKYFFCIMLMLMGVEAISLACLVAIIAFFLCDLMKAAERKGI